MTLGVRYGDTIEVRASGAGRRAAVDALDDLITPAAFAPPAARAPAPTHAIVAGPRRLAAVIACRGVAVGKTVRVARGDRGRRSRRGFRAGIAPLQAALATVRATWRRSPPPRPASSAPSSRPTWPCSTIRNSPMPQATASPRPERRLRVAPGHARDGDGALRAARPAPARARRRPARPGAPGAACAAGETSGPARASRSTPSSSPTSCCPRSSPARPRQRRRHRDGARRRRPRTSRSSPRRWASPRWSPRARRCSTVRRRDRGHSRRRRRLLRHRPDPPPSLRRGRAGAHQRGARDAARAGRRTEPARRRDGGGSRCSPTWARSAEARPRCAAGAEGCGLLRTEFLFLDRDEAPDEDEQATAYQAIADALGGRPLIIRTLDVGGDKPLAYLPLPHEENPALGLRGVRASLWRPDLLRTQLRAILRVAPAGACADHAADGDRRFRAARRARACSTRAATRSAIGRAGAGRDDRDARRGHRSPTSSPRRPTSSPSAPTT